MQNCGVSKIKKNDPLVVQPLAKLKYILQTLLQMAGQIFQIIFTYVL